MTKKEMLKIFRKQLTLEKELQDSITLKTYNSLNEVDKIIIDRLAKHYRKSDNYTYLAFKTHYAKDSILYRLNKIYKLLKHNIDNSN